MKTQKLKVTLNEIKRMQELAGIRNLNESNDPLEPYYNKYFTKKDLDSYINSIAVDMVDEVGDKDMSDAEEHNFRGHRFNINSAIDTIKYKTQEKFRELAEDYFEGYGVDLKILDDKKAMDYIDGLIDSEIDTFTTD